MARVHTVAKARKAIPDSGVQVGDTYYWWKFRFGGRRISKTYPKRSQLTQSVFLGQVYDIEDRISTLDADETLPDQVAEIAQELRDLASECESNRSNMPDHLQDSPTGELLQEREEACNNAADELDEIDLNPPGDEEEDPEQYWADKLDEVQQISVGI